MYFVNIMVKALLVELLCLIIIDANGMFLYFPGLHDNYHYNFNFCICGALRNLGPFVQLKKREKHPWRSVNFSKVAGFATLLNVI